MNRRGYYYKDAVEYWREVIGMDLSKIELVGLSTEDRTE